MNKEPQASHNTNSTDNLNESQDPLEALKERLRQERAEYAGKLIAELTVHRDKMLEDDADIADYLKADYEKFINQAFEKTAKGINSEV